MRDADDIIKDWKIQRAFGPSELGPICLCGVLLQGTLPKHEGEAVDMERWNADRVIYPGKCPFCRREGMGLVRSYPRPRWSAYRSNGIMRALFRIDSERWVEKRREQISSAGLTEGSSSRPARLSA